MAMGSDNRLLKIPSSHVRKSSYGQAPVCSKQPFCRLVGLNTVQATLLCHPTHNNKTYQGFGWGVWFWGPLLQNETNITDGKPCYMASHANHTKKVFLAAKIEDQHLACPPSMTATGGTFSSALSGEDSTESPPSQLPWERIISVTDWIQGSVSPHSLPH